MFYMNQLVTVDVRDPIESIVSMNEAVKITNDYKSIEVNNHLYCMGSFKLEKECLINQIYRVDKKSNEFIRMNQSLQIINFTTLLKWRNNIIAFGSSKRQYNQVFEIYSIDQNKSNLLPKLPIIAWDPFIVVLKNQYLVCISKDQIR